MSRVHGAVKRDRGGVATLLIAVAVVCGFSAAMLNPTVIFAHHIEYDATATCEGWQAEAHYVGGENQRLVVIADVKINGVPYNPAWSAMPVVPYNAATVGAIQGGPTGSQLYMWIGTSPGWTIFDRSGTGAVLPGQANWTGTIYIYRKDNTPHWEQSRAPVHVWQPQGPTNCATPTQPPATATQPACVPPPANDPNATPAPGQPPFCTTPTATKTATPVETAAGVRTPGPRPQPPSAGGGLAELSSTNMLFALLGILALSGGIAFLALGRSPAEEE